MSWRGWLRKIHLVVGLTTGLIVFVVAVTGALFVFEKEIFALLHRDAVRVEGDRGVGGPEGSTAREPPASLGTTTRLPLSELRTAALEVLPEDRKITWIQVFRDPSRTVVFWSRAQNPDAETYFARIRHEEAAYVDPCSGRVQAVIDHEHHPLQVIRYLHQELLLGETGSWIVGVATLTFFLMVATGLVLWIPRNASGWPKRFRVKWSTNWKRTNYDLHSVLGFYGHALLVFIAATGLVWSFSWWEGGAYWLLGGDANPDFSPPPVTASAGEASAGRGASAEPIDRVFSKAARRDPEFRHLNITPPGGPDAPWVVYTAHPGRIAEQVWDTYYFHPESGTLVGARPHEEKPVTLQWRNANYDLHTGAFWGLPTKVLFFMASLLCASLPVTGFLVWWGRTRKRRRARSSAPGRSSADLLGSGREGVATA